EKAKRGDTVRVHYTGSLEDGTVFDTSRGGEPLEFTIGAGEIIPGFEEAVIGMTPGESKRKLVPAKDAYGLARPERTVQVDRDMIPGELQLFVGQELEIEDQHGRVTNVVVKELTDKTVTLDGNHPLAGKDLQFQIELVEIVSA
ncbi:MAG TPA: peptidylprolyl isomerase, partial [Bryobacteraceae bacterium]|nr:peptidylprolyl isomerase [Bryobacteraceae bacterium]